jgi:hypothetical protein
MFLKDHTKNGNGHVWLFELPKVRNFSDLERLPNQLPKMKKETTVALLLISKLVFQKKNIYMPPVVTHESKMQMRFPTNIPRSRFVI